MYERACCAAAMEAAELEGTGAGGLRPETVLLSLLKDGCAAGCRRAAKASASRSAWAKRTGDGAGKVLSIVAYMRSNTPHGVLMEQLRG